MILTDKEIRNMVESYVDFDLEKPLIEPFDENKLQGASYDISISNIIYRYKTEFKTIDIEKQSEIDDIYDKVTIDKGYNLGPKEYILVTLNETINLSSGIIAHIRPRTRFTRLGLLLSSQHCNPTYTGRLKLGLFNATPYAIKIISDLKIGQFVFEELKSIPSENKWYKDSKDAAYNNEDDFIGFKKDKLLDEKVDKIYERFLNGLLQVGDKDDE